MNGLLKTKISCLIFLVKDPMKKKQYQKNNILTKDRSVFFATFAPYENNKRLPTNGMVEPLMSFLLPKIKRFLIIIQPHPGSDRINPIIEIYEDNKLKRNYVISSLFYFPIFLICKFQNTSKTHVAFKLRDFFSVLFTGLDQKERYDFFIGLECINTLAGIILRRIGKVKKVIYYVSDYSPMRFGNNFFNSVYVWLDRFCAVNADYIWDVSSAMQPARIKAGLNIQKSAPGVLVPNALFSSQIAYLDISKRIPYSLIYMGTLGYENGPDLAIEVLPKIKKLFSQTKLNIIGGGQESLKRLEKLVKKLNLRDSVVFHGFIADNDKKAEVIKQCYIALAPYRSIENSVRWYADATKIRQYLGCGLPVVTTHVPPLGKQIVSGKAGIVTNDTKEEYSDAIISLFSDKSLYTKMSKNAIRLGRKNTWENSYRQAFLTMENYPE